MVDRATEKLHSTNEQWHMKLVHLYLQHLIYDSYGKNQRQEAVTNWQGDTDFVM